MLDQIDSAIIAKCTTLSHFLQRKAGITNYSVANFGTFLVAISVFLLMGNYFHQIFDFHTGGDLLAIDAMLFAATISISFGCVKANDYLGSGKTAKPRVLVFFEGIWWRIPWPCLLMVYTWAEIFGKRPRVTCWMIQDSIEIVLGLGMMICFYFIMVEPLLWKE